MRAMVSPALPALTVLTASIERLGQSCARAAGAEIIRTAHAMAPHHLRNDIDTSLECRRSSIDFVGLVGLRMMPPIGARTQPAAPALRSRVAWAPIAPFCLDSLSVKPHNQSDRGANPNGPVIHRTCFPGRVRVSRAVASTHVGRKECLQCVTTV